MIWNMLMKGGLLKDFLRTNILLNFEKAHQSWLQGTFYGLGIDFMA